MTQIKKPASDPDRPVFETLQRVPLEELDEAVRILKQQRPAHEVCGALMTFIATAPLADFAVLREVYRKHCADRT